MKIGLITTTFPNYGSRLQNIASIQIAQNTWPGSTVETIVISRVIKSLKIPSLFKKVLCVFYKYWKFRGPLNKNKGIINYKVYAIDDTDILDLQILNTKYDLFLIGSDQIWTCLGPSYKFFFGAFTNKKICNSPSMLMNKEEIYKNKHVLKELLETFDSLNVREKSVAHNIKELLGLSCGYLEDPVFRVKKDYWGKLINQIRSVKLRKENYALIYILKDLKMFQNLKNVIESKMPNQLIDIYQKNNGQKDKFDFTPLEFLKVIHDSSVVITNSFHCACFAQIFSKELYLAETCFDDPRFDCFKTYNKTNHINKLLTEIG